jgi:hypothetical protein
VVPTAEAAGRAAACPHPRPGGGRCRSRRCSSCGLLWAGDTRRKLLANVEHYAADVALVTITAPGTEGVPYWARSQTSGGAIRWVDVPDWRAHRIRWLDPTDRTKGAHPTDAYRWNRSAPGRWRDLHRAARQRALRDGHRVTLLARTWEYQRRGLLHVHAPLGVGTAAELAGAHAYVDALAALAPRYGFGFVDRGRRRSGRHGRALEIIPAARAARYVAKYLSPLDDEGKPTLSETVTKPDVPAQVAYVSRTLTQATGVTMRYLRWRRLAWVLRVDPDTGETLDSMLERGQRTGDLTDFVGLLRAIHDF